MIRKAKREDVKDINRLLSQVKKVHVKIRGDLFKDGPNKYDDNEIIKMIENNDITIFIYEKSQKIVGYIFCKKHTIKDDNVLNDAKELYIDDLCVDEEYRHQGIGKEMYNFIYEYAKNNNYDYITLNVWNNNDSAISFYKSLGMNCRKIMMEQKIKKNQ